jgi:hypothetical protein
MGDMAWLAIEINCHACRPSGLGYSFLCCSFQHIDAEEKYVDFDLGASTLLGGMTIDFGIWYDDTDPYCNIFIDVWDEGEPEPPRRAAAPSPAAQPTPLPTGAPPPAHECAVCGDLNTKTPCSEMEIMLLDQKQCPDDAPYCMNDFMMQDGATTVYKRLLIPWRLIVFGGCRPLMNHCVISLTQASC